jgi:hypothetical protein
VIGAKAKSFLDFGARLAFFATAPFLLVFVAAIFPVTGALVQIGVALVAFVAGEAVRALADRSRLARFVLGSQLAFEAYYREHPPRPFLYYVFYPLLMPYWLSVREARREFLLYKGYTLTTFALLVASLVYQFETAFPPELRLRDFLPIAAGTLLAEAIVVLMFLMPMVTSVVHFHKARAPRRLALLLVAAIVSIGFAAARLERRRDPMVSYATRARVRLRSEARPARAREAHTAALRAAWRELSASKDDVDTDGKVAGVALQKAHDALAAFYKGDEANAFDLWYARKRRSAVLVVYFEARRGAGPIWLAMDGSGVPTHDDKRLPRGAFLAMRHAAE